MGSSNSDRCNFLSVCWKVFIFFISHGYNGGSLMIKKLKCGAVVNTKTYKFYRLDGEYIEFVYKVTSKGHGEDYHLVIRLKASEEELYG